MPSPLRAVCLLAAATLCACVSEVDGITLADNTDAGVDCTDDSCDALPTECLSRGDGDSLWPGSDRVASVDDPAAGLGGNSSGITFEAGTDAPATLWLVRNGPERMYQLVRDPKSGQWRNVESGGWLAGKQLRFPLGHPEGENRAPDSEGITRAEPANRAVYVASERMLNPASESRLSILRYPTDTAGDEVNASHEWNLTAALPTVGANEGLESITWIPDQFLVARGFHDSNLDQLYRPSDYPDHGAGLFFAGLEENGTIYVFALDHGDDQRFSLLAEFSSGEQKNMGLEFDRDSQVLWANCDNSCGNGISALEIESGRFIVAQNYVRPGNLANSNHEGIAIAPATECEGELKGFFWVDDSGGDGSTIYADDIPCASFCD